MNTPVKWFLAELIFRLHDKSNPAIRRFDKHYRPLKAASAKEAYQLALIAASQELDKRSDYTKEYLQWEFIGLERLEQIERLSVRNEYHKTMKTPGNIPAYIQSLRIKNALIQAQLTETA